MDADEIGSEAGAICGNCRLYFGDREGNGGCTVVKGTINGPRGICGLYVNGTPAKTGKSGTLDPSTVGYELVGPTHCGSCKFFDERGSCKIVEGQIEAGGCCNAWQGESKREWKI